MAGVAGRRRRDRPCPGPILYHEGFRRELELAQRAFLTRFNLGADGRAAERAAEAIVRLARSSTSNVTSHVKLPT